MPGELLFDRSAPPSLHMNLEQRDESTYSYEPSTTTIRPSSTSGSASKASGTLAVATQTAMASLPRPFDSSLGNNFTSPSCPAFFTSFLSNETFRNCLPLSLLLQTSTGFFADTRSPFRLTQTLDATCNVNLHHCSAVMARLAQEIQLPNNCGADLGLRNPMVMQAYDGFVAYEPLYHAGCLTDDDGNYCFADAATNASAPASSYIYYLPLGVPFPGGSQPSCDSCLRKTMAVFSSYATNSSQPLNSDYESAAEQIDTTCGPKFVDTRVQMNSATGKLQNSSAVCLLTVLVILTHFLL